MHWAWIFVKLWISFDKLFANIFASGNLKTCKNFFVIKFLHLFTTLLLAHQSHDNVQERENDKESNENNDKYIMSLT